VGAHDRAAAQTRGRSSLGGLSARAEPLGALRDFFFAPVPIYPLLLARVLWGLALLVAYLALLPDVPALFGPAGLAGAEWLPPQFHGWRLLTPVYAWVESALPPLALAHVWTCYAILIAAAACFSVGFWTRSSGALLLACHLFLVQVRNPLAFWGWAAMLDGLLAYLLCAPVGRFWSVDAWLERRRTGAPPPPAAAWTTVAWPLRLVQVNVCTMYYLSGFTRIDDHGWLDGQALYQALAHRLHGRWPFELALLERAKPLLALLTYATFVVEPLAIALLWLPRVGTSCAVWLIGMHVGLELFTEVGGWNLVMIGGLLCFLPTTWLAALFRRLPGGPSA